MENLLNHGLGHVGRGSVCELMFLGALEFWLVFGRVPKQGMPHVLRKLFELGFGNVD